MQNFDLLHVNSELCVNCHACIAACPVKFCNDGSGDHVGVDNKSCLSCAECVRACTHDARHNRDDFDAFLESVEKQEPMVAILAPAAAAVFPERVPHLIGWLRSLGAEAVFDVSFGAELATLSYVEHIRRNHPRTVIAQPCPAVVRYIELYRPELIPYLAPCGSPMDHLMRMIRRYHPDYRRHRMVVISPCVAKKNEFRSLGDAAMNVTMMNLRKHFETQGIDLAAFPASSFDGPHPERAVLFSSPGGLMRTAERWCPGITERTRRIEGPALVYPYLDHLAEEIRLDRAPLLVDCLNCVNGCNGGTGTGLADRSPDELEYWVERRKEEMVQPQKGWWSRRRLEHRIRSLWEPGLYERTYQDQHHLADYQMPDDEELKKIFASMGKFTDADVYNCNACGYGTCRQMARAIHNGMNRPENCYHFLASRSVQVVEAMAQGNLPAHFDGTKSGAIGELEHSLNRMIDFTTEFVTKTQQVAQGKYDVDFPMRSESDELCLAMESMTRSLSAMAEGERENAWKINTLNELADVLRGEHEPDRLAASVVQFLSRRLDALVGVIYLVDGDDRHLLRRTGCWCHAEEPDAAATIHVGEGLVGQCALDKKPIVPAEVPPGHLRVSSSTGESDPPRILLHPLRHDDQVLGVVEFGLPTSAVEKALNFLSEAERPIALAVAVAESRAQTARLLETTKRQAEQLREQQEELQQINEELEERSERLEEQTAVLQNQQEELQQANEELEEHTQALEQQQGEIKRKNRDLETVRLEIEERAQELEQVSRYKSEFLANMSHELRTPLNSMLILSRILSENKASNLTEKQVEFAATIHKAGSDLLGLINDILDLSKIEAGRVEFHREPIDLSDMMEDIRLLFQAPFQEKGVALVVELSKDTPRTIESDTQRLQQIIKNLVGNALKFTQKGSVSIRVRTPSKTEPAGMAVVFSIEDTGLGIAPENQKKVFEAFKQADGSTSRTFGGTGLGLSISRELAHKMGGDIHLQSTVGKGCIFRVFLPAALPMESSTPPSDSGKHPGKKAPRTPTSTRPDVEPHAKPFPESAATSIKDAEDAGDDDARGTVASPIGDDRDTLQPGEQYVLVIEDDINFARVLVDLIQERKLKAFWAGNGRDGLKQARAHPPSGIFLDIMLPEIDGWAVLQMLKDDPVVRHVPVHVVSCLDRPLDALRLGAIGYLTKPVSLDQLNGAMERIQTISDDRPRHLLIVEDNVEEAKSLEALLESEQVKATIAHSGQEAIERMAEESFDCIVLDLGLQDMSGFTLLDTIRAKSADHPVPVIIHTGRDLTSDEEQRLRRYASSIVVKGAQSPERLLDEATLFLHLVEGRLPERQQQLIRLAHDPERSLADRTVLLVDDDMRNLFALTSALEGLGMKIIPAVNGEEALAKLSKNMGGIDLVLMDIMMPVMDGYEAIRRIRADEKLKRVPIIALTAKAMKDDRRKCIEVGADDYLSKPVDMDQLLTLIRVWVAR